MSSTKANAASSSAAVSAKSMDSSDTRRLKKRELDRRCQRMARDRTKAHIAHLEKLVEEFQQQDSTGRISALIEQLDTVKKERDELAKTLSSIAKLTQPHESRDIIKTESISDEKSKAPVQISTGSSDAPDVDDVGTVDRDGSFTASPGDEPIADEFITTFSTIAPSTGEMNNAFLDADPVQMLESNQWMQPRSPMYDSQQHHVPRWQPIPGPVCACSEPTSNWTMTNKPKNIWRFANDVLVAATTPASKARIAQAGSMLDEDIPIRAVRDGWDSVYELGGHLPSWQALRQIDEAVFFMCPDVERLAILYTMNGLIRAHAEAGDERLQQLPSWFRTKPAATNSAEEPYAVSYFTWPGLRQKFRDSPHRYCLNDFWKLFVKDFRFSWPYDFRDCYTTNKVDKAFHLSPDFVERLRDLRSWKLGPSFFNRFPELYNDIPAVESIPGVVWHAPGPQLQLIQRHQQQQQHHCKQQQQQQQQRQRQRQQQQQQQQQQLPHRPENMTQAENMAGSIPYSNQGDIGVDVYGNLEPPHPQVVMRDLYGLTEPGFSFPTTSTMSNTYMF